MVRQGRFKLIEFGHALAQATAPHYPPLLFDLDEDPFEQNNLAQQHPAVAQRLRAAAGVNCDVLDGRSKLWDYVYVLHLIDDSNFRRQQRGSMNASVWNVLNTLLRTCYAPWGDAKP